MSKEKTFVEKKLRGSGGFAIAEINDDEQKMANLGGPELFLAGIGKLDKNRFKKYYCNKCEKEYQGSPNIEFENPNEDLGENIMLIEKGEYKCKSCNYVIAQYRKFNELKEDEDSMSKKIENKNPDNNKVIENKKEKEQKQEEEKINEKENEKVIIGNVNTTKNNDDNRTLDMESQYVHIEKIIGMSVYDNNALLVGKVKEIGLRKISGGKVEFSFKINDSNNEVKDMPWNKISKIGDIIILSGNDGDDGGNNNINNNNDDLNTNNSSTTKTNMKTCKNCNHNNEAESIFCEECGKKLE